MMQKKITSISESRFRDLTAGKKVVLLYPRTDYRNLFLAYFLQNADDGFLYYRVSEDETTISNFLDNLVREFRDIFGDFGANISGILTTGTPESLGQALAQDLADIDVGGRKIVYFDEVDKIELTDNMRQFFDALIHHLSDDTQLVVNGRILTHKPWVTLVEKGEAVVLGTDSRSSDLLFSTDEPDRPQLEIYAFGRGHAIVNGREVVSWDGALPRNLFFYFVDNKLVTRDEIFEVFWPDLNVKEATNVFHVTKRKITERISSKVFEEGNYELTQYGGGFYTPSDKVTRHYDVADFEDALDKAAMTLDDDEQAMHYKRAIDIYKAPFLQTIDMPWVVERREKLQRMFTDALIGMGRIHKEREEYEAALGYFLRALKETPQREDIYREVMSLYNKLGRREDALEQYQILEKRLEATVGVGPSPETKRLYDEIAAMN